MICALCQRPGAGLRYQGPGAARWFHAMCWERVRTFVFMLDSGCWFAEELTDSGECADNGDAGKAGPVTVLTLPANPPTPLGSSKRHLGAAVSVDGAADLAQPQSR